MRADVPLPVRFAPSTTGPAHPGTLLSALLVWLDGRSRGARVDLRLEDLDPQRSTPALTAAMVADLEWFGLSWDSVVRQSDLAAQHADALDRLAAAGRLYPCDCGRSRLAALGRRAPDGGWAYDNHCRGRALPPGGWRAAVGAVRLRLPDTAVREVDEGGLDLSQRPSQDMGDPVVRRRDGATAYQLATVVYDAAGAYRRLIRGHDLAASAGTQLQIYELIGASAPVLRHHLLLLEPRGDKLAKLHGAVGVPTLRMQMSAAELCGVLAHGVGLTQRPQPCLPADLVGGFDWARVARSDRVAVWDGRRLSLRPG